MSERLNGLRVGVLIEFKSNAAVISRLSGLRPSNKRRRADVPALFKVWQFERLKFEKLKPLEVPAFKGSTHLMCF